MPAIGVAPYNEIAIVNTSTGMTDAEGEIIVAALNEILPTFCSDWNLKAVTAVFVPTGAPKTTIPLCCIVADTTDVDNALGYHDQSEDVPYAKVFVKTILQYNGAILQSEDSKNPTAAQTISHEVFELLVDPRANVWWADSSGTTLIAAEVSDPVGSNVVPVIVNGTSVSLSDWILPTWSDPQAMTGPFNHNDTLKAPLTVDNGGYLIVLRGGYYTHVYGSDVSDYNKQQMSRRSALRCKTPSGNHRPSYAKYRCGITLLLPQTSEIKY